jgi:hypothetical protein
MIFPRQFGFNLKCVGPIEEVQRGSRVLECPGGTVRSGNVSNTINSGCWTLTCLGNMLVDT